MKLEAKNRLVMTRATVAVRRTGSHEGCYSWVWIISLQSGQFRIAAIDVPNPLVDSDASFFEEDMDTPYLNVVDSINEVDQAVREAGVDPDELDAPWHSDFPLQSCLLRRG